MKSHRSRSDGVREASRAPTVAAAVISVFLLFAPLLKWPKSYLLQGDGGGLQYLDARAWLRVAFSVFDTNPGNLGFYAPGLDGVPLGIALAGLQAAVPDQVNAQLFVFGLALTSGFLGVKTLVQTILLSRSSNARWASVIAGLVFVLSPTLALTGWMSLLPWILSIGVVPWVLWLLVLAVRRTSYLYALLAALTTLLIPNPFWGMPWYLPLPIVLLAVLGPFVAYRARRVMSTVLVFFLACLGLHSYWLVHHAVATVKGGALQQTLDPVALVSEAQSVAQGLSLSAALALSPQWRWYARFDPSMIGNFPEVAQITTPLTAIAFCSLIVIALAISFKRKYALYSIGFGLLGFVAALYLYVPSAVPKGNQLFAWLLMNIPGLGALRNMWDKLPLTLSMLYAILVGVALFWILRGRRPLLALIPAALILLSLASNAVPFLNGDLLRHRFEPVGLSFQYGLSKWDSNYLAVIEQVENRVGDSGERVLGVPLTQGAYAFIRDDDEQETFFVGTSPLYALSGIRDITGMGVIPSLGVRTEDLRWALEQRDINGTQQVLNDSGIGWIMVTKDLPKDLLARHAVGEFADPISLLDVTQFLIAAVDGQMVYSNDNYDLYRVGKKAHIVDVLTSPKLGDFDAAGFDRVDDVSVARDSEGAYRLSFSLEPRTSNVRIILKEPVHWGWRLRIGPESGCAASNGVEERQQFQTWNLTCAPAPERKEIAATIFFEPTRYTQTGLFVSASSFAIIMVVVLGLSMNSIRSWTAARREASVSERSL